MRSSGHAVIVAVFDERLDAERAVEALESIGLSESEVGYSVGRADAPQIESPHRHERGAHENDGGVIARGMLTAHGGGAAQPGLLSRLVSIGVPADAARLYEEEWLAGRAIVAVAAPARATEVWDVLRAHGARTPAPAGARTESFAPWQTPSGVERTGTEANQIDGQEHE